MAEPWFRCHADLASKRVTWRLSRELNVSIPLAAGHLALLWGKLSIEYAAGRFDGQIASVTTEQIEKYAQWRGEKGAFGKWVRERHTDHKTGTLREWDAYMGALAKQRQSNAARVSNWREQNRARDNENQRKRRERERAEKEQQQSKSAVDVTRNVRSDTAAVADVTNYVAPLSTNHLEKLLSEIVNDNAFKDKSLSATTNSTNGKKPAGVTSELLRSLLERYMLTFYGEASDERVEAVTWQLHAALNSERGAHVARNEPRAVATPKTLFNAITDTLAERDKIADKDKAIVVTLKKLQSGSANLDVDESGATVTERASAQTRVYDAQPIEDARAAELISALARSKSMPEQKQGGLPLSKMMSQIMNDAAEAGRDVLRQIEHDARDADARSARPERTSEDDIDASSLD